MAISGWYKSGCELLDEMRFTRIPNGMLAIWYLGQSGIVIKSREGMFAIDLYLGHPEPNVRRFPAPFAPKELNFFDAVLCTHNHKDHLDPYTLTGIATASSQTRFIVPRPWINAVKSCNVEPENILGAIVGERMDISDVSIYPVPAAHEELSKDLNGDYENLGYILTFGAATLYHAGDTIEWKSMILDLHPYSIDIACLPINGNDWKRKRANIIGNLNSREAANVADEIGADLLIPLHYDLFPYNGENPGNLSNYMFQEHLGHKYHFMAPGERFWYSR